MAANRRKKKSKTGHAVVVILTIFLLLLVSAVIFMLYRMSRGEGIPFVASAHRESEDKTLVASSSGDSFMFSYKGESQADKLTGTSQEGSGAAETDKSEPKELPQISGENLMSQYALMTRLSDGGAAYEKASTERIYPASLTKIMTVLVAIENSSDLNKQVIITQEDIDPGFESGASQVGFIVGEGVTVKDLLYGAMLPSGADACYALGYEVSGSIEEFIQLMNDRAAEMGLENTHFANCTGLHDEELYTTVADLSKLLSQALQNQTFREVFTTTSYKTSTTTEHPDGINLHSRMAMMLSDALELENGTVILGGKTGYTDEAGYCLASLARSADGQEYILVTAQAQSPQNEEGADLYEFPGAVDAHYIYGQLPSA